MKTLLPLRPNVCMLLMNSEKKLFLGERRGETGHWQLPQGGAEPGLSGKENALRELEEETGISRRYLQVIKQLRALHEYEWTKPPAYAAGRWRGQSQTFWLIEFTGADSEINLDTLQPEFQSWRWCTVAELRQLCSASGRVRGYEQALSEYEEYISGR